MKFTMILGGRGTSFLKGEARELLMSDDETDSNVPKIISSVDPVKESNVRSILKGSPTQKIGQDSKPKKSLRVSNTAADSSNNRPDETRRIQFHIEEKQAPPPKKVEKVESTSDEEVIKNLPKPAQMMAAECRHLYFIFFHNQVNFFLNDKSIIPKVFQ